MIKSVTVYNYLGDSLIINLSRPEETGLVITNIDGLGPVNANINTTDFATIDGASFNSARIQSRNIVITFRILDNPSVEENRHRLYHYFSVKRYVTLDVETDRRRSQIKGYVESVEPIIFSSEEEATVSIICPDPFFYKQETTDVAFTNVTPLFEFPFENNGTTPQICFGDIMSQPVGNIDYPGDYAVGFVATILLHGEAEYVTIFNIDDETEMRIDTAKITAILGEPLQDEDEIIINTRTGNKTAYLLRHGLYTNILNAIDRSSDWLVLRPGANLMAYSAIEGAENIELIVTYQTVYEGV